MTDAAPPTCATCGAAVTGRFCSACGAEAGPRTCAACQSPLSAQARFCHRCGRPVSGAPDAVTGRVGQSGRSERMAWLVAGTAVALLLLLIVYRVVRDRPAAAAPDMANAGNSAPAGGPGAGDPGGALPTGRAPDISKLSPAERFLRLNNRIMDAAARGDTTTLITFTPMALGAYSQLDTITNDERYHAAVLHAQIGQLAEARALADTMLLRTPGYLLAYVVRGDIAEFRRDSVALHAAYADFRRHYAAEDAARREEYADHADVIQDFKRKAGV